jgi:hypothetical protein
MIHICNKVTKTIEIAKKTSALIHSVSVFFCSRPAINFFGPEKSAANDDK